MRIFIAALLVAINYAQTDLGFCGLVGGNAVYDNVNSDTFNQFLSSGINWYWNWDVQRKGADGPFPSSITFVPTFWGGSGTITPTPNMAKTVLGWNEPDIAGMCQGICDPKDPTHCDYTHLGWNPFCMDNYALPPMWCDQANPAMKAFPSAQPTGIGYWPFSDGQDGWHCPDANGGAAWSNQIRSEWSTTWNAVPAGFKITAPMLADATTNHWIKRFTESISPSERPNDLVFHWYGSGCPQNTSTTASIGGWQNLIDKLEVMIGMIKSDYPSAKIWITEIGLLQTGVDGEQKCPSQTLTWVMDEVFNLFMQPSYAPYIAHICWFGTHSAGNTFDTAVVDKDGQINIIGQKYMQRCKQMDEFQSAFLKRQNVTNV